MRRGHTSRLSASSSSSSSPPESNTAGGPAYQQHQRTPALTAAFKRISPAPSSSRVRRAQPAVQDPAKARRTASGSSRVTMEDDSELARCSREQLLEMVTRQREELHEAQEKAQQLEEAREGWNSESSALGRDLEAAKNRIDEIMGDQSRMEEELAGRIEVLDKLRASMRELEREKRDSSKRYREQAESFDSERQSWYDQEQHYKLRIQNLTDKNRKPRKGSTHDVVETITPAEPTSVHEGSEDEDQSPSARDRSATPVSPSNRSRTASPTPSSSAGPSPAELALQDQLISLTTAHSSLTNTLRTLQTEMADLKRVYQDLQEENESYEILLGEKTLNGEVRGTELFRQSFHWSESGEDGPPQGLGFLGGLEAVEEDDFSDLEGDFEDDSDDGDDIERILEAKGTGSPDEGAVAAGNEKRRGSKAKKARPSGGLDLAAELEAAQMDDTEAEEKEKRRQEKMDRRRASQARKASAAQQGERRGSVMQVGNVEELRSEVKSLREANKALTLYVSKIVDRVCSQEGFEKVLAVDYRTVTPKEPSASTLTPAQPDETPVDQIKFRPAGLFRANSSSSTPAKEIGPKDKEPSTPSTAASPTTPSSSGHRKGGIGWDSFSAVFSLSRNTSTPSPTPPVSSVPPPPPPAGMKPLMLSADGSARKLEVEEDEDDIRERERLRAEMAQLGIDGEKAGNQWGTRTPPTVLPDSPSPTPPPKDVDAEAAAVILRAKVQEEDAKAELNQGRASGFTDGPRKLSMRSRGSSLKSLNGLGIDGRVTPEGSPALGGGTSSPLTSPKVPSVDANGEEVPPTWGKALRRLSRGWSSPPMA